MKVDRFIKELTDIIDTEKKLTLDTALNEIEEWDSVSMVSFFFLLQGKFSQYYSVAGAN